MKLVSRHLGVGSTLATIGPYLEAMPKLLKLLSHRPLPELDPMHNEQSVFHAISGACMTSSMATIITKLLLMHVQARGVRLKTLRVNPLHVFSEHSYPVLEWTETDGSKNITIFYIEGRKECVQSHQDNKNGSKGKQKCIQCRLSWLMLSIIKTDEDREKIRLNWSVSHLSHVRLLFHLAQHLFGVSQWSKEDKLNLYCRQNFGDCELTE